MSVRFNGTSQGLKRTPSVQAQPWSYGLFFKIVALPAVSGTIATLVQSDTSGGAEAQLLSDGHLRLLTESSGHTADSTAALSTDTWYYASLELLDGLGSGSHYQLKYLLAGGASVIETIATTDFHGTQVKDQCSIATNRVGSGGWANISATGDKVFSVAHDDAAVISEAGQIAPVDSGNAVYSDALPDASTLGGWTGVGTPTTDADNPTFGGGPLAGLLAAIADELEEG